MKRKLLALALVIAFFGGSQNRHLRFRPSTDALEASVPLLPPSIGPYSITERRWRNVLGNSVVEQGAIYSAPDGGEVQLDLRLHSPVVHNGAYCDLIKGASLVTQQVREVRTRDSGATFGISLFRDNDRLRLVAATECFSRRCTETPVVVAGWRLPKLSLNTLLDPRRDPSTPVSVVIERAVSSDGWRAAEQRLLAEFERFAAELDLTAVRQLSAME